jgi:ArsR family transcriptional regulator
MCKEDAEIFRILSVESRIRIIELLKKKGPLGAVDIAEALGISTSAVSQHLKILKYAGIVKSERKGYSIPYEVNPDALDHCKHVAMKVCTCCCCPPEESTKTKEELELLKQYQEHLQKELEKVEKRIQELKDK